MGHGPDLDVYRLHDRPSPVERLAGSGEKGHGISVYVVDASVDAPGLFESFSTGYDAVGTTSKDCAKGHGTLVASIVAARGYGVAESATVVPVRVLDCRGMGMKRAVVKGLEWVITHARPASSVVNLSFVGRQDPDLDALVSQIANRGIPVVIAAGNGATDSSRFSPSRTGCDERLAIVVAASTEVDSPWTGSNYGGCVSIFAPGTNVRAFDSNGPRTVTGTSFAAPYVAGAIAAYASEYGVSTQEAWRMVIGHSLPAINVGKMVNTTTRLVHMFSADTLAGDCDAPGRFQRAVLRPFACQ